MMALESILNVFKIKPENSNNSATLCQNILIKHIDHLASSRVVVLGDIMLDTYLFGSAYRISPEAPVPIVHVKDEYSVLGGAGNVAKNIAALGGKALFLGACGDDSSGKLLEGLLSQEQIETELLFDKERTTIVKTRILAQQQQMLRFDREVNNHYSHELKAIILEKIRRIISDYKVVICSDYNKGAIYQELVSFLVDTKSNFGFKVLVDPKPQNIIAYIGVDLVTPNLKEATLITGKDLISKDDLVEATKAIQSKLNIKEVIITLGADGMVVLLESGDVWHIPTVAQKVFDVTGAGDTVIAVLGLALASGVPLIDSCLLANYAAGLVVEEVGAAVVTLDKLENVIKTTTFPNITCWYKA